MAMIQSIGFPTEKSGASPRAWASASLSARSFREGFFASIVGAPPPRASSSPSPIQPPSPTKPS